MTARGHEQPRRMPTADDLKREQRSILAAALIFAVLYLISLAIWHWDEPNPQPDHDPYQYEYAQRDYPLME